MRMCRWWCGLVFVAMILASLDVSLAAESPGWKVGIAKAKITPQKPFWMAGFSSRSRPSVAISCPPRSYRPA